MIRQRRIYVIRDTRTPSPSARVFGDAASRAPLTEAAQALSAAGDPDTPLPARYPR